MSHFSEKKEQQKIAKQRIKVLFEQAENMFKKDAALSDRYVRLARRLSMRYKVKIPSYLKRRFCRHCYRYLMPGKTVLVRTSRGKVVYTCLYCKKHMRFQYS